MAALALHPVTHDTPSGHRPWAPPAAPDAEAIPLTRRDRAQPSAPENPSPARVAAQLCACARLSAGVARAGPAAQGPEARGQGPGARGQGPGTGDRGPGTRDRGPGARGQGPGTGDRGPGTRDRGPGTGGQGPGTGGGGGRARLRGAAIRGIARAQLAEAVLPPGQQRAAAADGKRVRAAARHRHDADRSQRPHQPGRSHAERALALPTLRDRGGAAARPAAA